MFSGSQDPLALQSQPELARLLREDGRKKKRPLPKSGESHLSPEKSGTQSSQGEKGV